MSLPVRECGLKHKLTWVKTKTDCVTPRAGVWIETFCRLRIDEMDRVTPRAGVWIETIFRLQKVHFFYVTPRAGVWIETSPSGHF